MRESLAEFIGGLLMVVLPGVTLALMIIFRVRGQMDWALWVGVVGMTLICLNIFAQYIISLRRRSF